MHMLAISSNVEYFDGTSDLSLVYLLAQAFQLLVNYPSGVSEILSSELAPSKRIVSGLCFLTGPCKLSRESIRHCAGKEMAMVLTESLLCLHSVLCALAIPRTQAVYVV